MGVSGGDNSKDIIKFIIDLMTWGAGKENEKVWIENMDAPGCMVATLLLPLLLLAACCLVVTEIGTTVSSSLPSLIL